MRDFADRREAGIRLAGKLASVEMADPVLLALVRGGVPVAVEIASRLKLPLDVLFVRRIGLPSHPDLAIAAVIDGAAPHLVRNEHILGQVHVDESYIARERDRQLAEIERRRRLYCGDLLPAQIGGRTAVIVDDGVATGTTVRAAVAAVRQGGAARITVATPVIAPDTAAEFRTEGVEVVSILEPTNFQAVGQFYRDFHQIEDDEVVELLKKARLTPWSDTAAGGH